MFVLLWGANRELDSFYSANNLLPVYDVTAFLFCGGLVAIAVLRFKDCWNVFVDGLRSLPMRLLVVGAVIYAVAQGKGVIVNAFGWERTAGRVIEESMELFGSMVFLQGAAELCWRRFNPATEPKTLPAAIVSTPSPRQSS